MKTLKEVGHFYLEEFRRCCEALITVEGIDLSLIKLPLEFSDAWGESEDKGKTLIHCLREWEYMPGGRQIPALIKLEAKLNGGPTARMACCSQVHVEAWGSIELRRSLPSYARECFVPRIMQRDIKPGDDLLPSLGDDLDFWAEVARMIRRSQANYRTKTQFKEGFNAQLSGQN